MRVVPPVAMRVAANGTGCQFSSNSAGRKVAHKHAERRDQVADNQLAAAPVG